MTDEEPFRRYLEAGMALFHITQQRAEELLDSARREVGAQAAGLGLATREDLAATEQRLLARIDELAAEVRRAGPPGS